MDSDIECLYGRRASSTLQGIRARKDKPNLNLPNFLETIEANLHLFNEPDFRERLKGNPFIDSLAREPRRPDAMQLRKDLESVSETNPLVKKLSIWRHRYVAHHSRTSALDPALFIAQNPLPYSEIGELITNGVNIVNRYSGLFSATFHTSLPVKDYQYLLDAVRRDLEAREARSQEHIAGIREGSAVQKKAH